MSIYVMEVVVRCISLNVIEVFLLKLNISADFITITWEITADRAGFSLKNRLYCLTSKCTWAAEVRQDINI